MNTLTRRNFLIAGAIGAAGALGLTGCGGNPSADSDTDPEAHKASQEDLLSEAEDFDAEGFFDIQNENEAKAKQEYDGKVFRASGYVEDIYTDYIIVSEFKYGVYCNPIIAELPEEEIAELSMEQEITVCGTFEYAEDPNLSRLVDAFIVE